MRTFKEQYSNKFQVLESSFHKEQKTLKQCKQKINEIWEKAQNVRSAVRMARQELDKIADLKKSVDDEQQRAAGRREEEKEKLAKIEALKDDIAEAERKAREAHELDEEIKLRQLKKQWDDLVKRKEEQDDKKMKHKMDAANLLKQQVAAQKMIESQLATLEKLNAGIKKAREDQDKANQEKIKLDDTTSMLQK